MALSLVLVSDSVVALAFQQRVGDLECRLRCFADAAAALQASIQSRPDLVLLDSQTEPLRWLQACRSFRGEAETRQTPLVVLCGQASSHERLALLEAGADDCWTEPLDSRECMLRLQAIVRRQESASSSHVLRYADVEFDLDRFKVRRNGKLIDLTPMQMKLLKHFMESPATVFSRRQLLDQLWGNPETDEGAVTACVIRLRRALNAAGPNLIRLVPASGYALDYDPEWDAIDTADDESELSQSANSSVMRRS